VGILLMALDNAEASGPINGTAPNPVRNAEFSRALAKALRRPFVPLGPPDAVLRVVLGEVAQVVTQGQKVLPARAQALGYTFRHPDLEGALRATFTAPPPPPPSPRPVPAASAARHHH
jgi:NAD dependent epimerase/dehydratase family enzyme